MAHRYALKWMLLSILFLIFPFIMVAQEETTNPLPMPTGPYQVGTTVYHWVDESRYEFLANSSEGGGVEPGSAVTTVFPAPIKAEPSITSATVATLEALEPVTVIEIDGHWARVEYGDSRGWIRSSNLINVDTSPENKRELVVQIWYPADVEAGATAAPYLPESDLVITEFSKIMREAFRVSVSLSADFPSHAFIDVPVSNDHASYPVLIFSHGLAAMPEYYHAQVEELASHGYIVAGINHTYSSTATIFPDGRTTTFGFPDPDIAIRVAAADQIFVGNQLEELNTDGNGMFAEKMNLEMLGAFGHSFGGAASALACSQDTRFRACLNQDGLIPFTVQEVTIDQPFMSMHSEGNATLNRALYSQLSGPGYSVVFDGFRHNNFIDFSLWPASEGDRTSMLIGIVPEMRSVQLINAYVLAFFDTS